MTPESQRCSQIVLPDFSLSQSIEPFLDIGQVVQGVVQRTLQQAAYVTSRVTHRETSRPGGSTRLFSDVGE